jgi:carboxyl-terminal processing protease
MYRSPKTSVLPALFLAFVFFLLGSCRNEDEPQVIQVPQEIQEINRFVQESMDIYYFWREFIPSGLNPDTEPDPRAFFDKMVYKAEDRWSVITDDVVSLTNSLKGIEKTFGHQFRLFRLGSTERVFGIVTYVLPDSPSARSGISRGDVFDRINGTPLTVDNYRGLLFQQEQYEIAFAELIDGELRSIERKLLLQAETLQENPVFYNSVIEYNDRKIAYLVYTQFIPDFNETLLQTFETFRAAGVRDLVLDLRYNPGGSIASAVLLGSLIAPREAGLSQDIFVRYLWNDLLRDFFLEREGENSSQLVNRLQPLAQNLDLDRVYVLISRNTASASELIINGLRPYMEVVLIGEENTNGKYTGSITLSDPDKKHSWAIQPIVLKSANAQGVTDFIDGFAPQHLVGDDYFAPLGSLEEDMLAKAVELIAGESPAVVARKTGPRLPSGSRFIADGGRVPIEDRQVMVLD